MRVLLVALLIGVLPARVSAAEPFPTEGWWSIPHGGRKVMEGGGFLKAERLRHFEPLVSTDSKFVMPDPLAELRQHPQEAWLLTIYRYDVHIGTAEYVRVDCRRIPVRISGDTMTLYDEGSPISYRIVNKKDRTELHFAKGGFAHSVFSARDRSGKMPAEVFHTSPNAVEEMKEMVMKFFQ